MQRVQQPEGDSGADRALLLAETGPEGDVKGKGPGDETRAELVYGCDPVDGKDNRRLDSSISVEKDNAMKINYSKLREGDWGVRVEGAEVKDGDTVTVTIDGTVAGTAPVVGGAWSFTPTAALSNASHTITATQAAAGGPASTAASDTFTVNVAGPSVTDTTTAGEKVVLLTPDDPECVSGAKIK